MGLRNKRHHEGFVPDQEIAEKIKTESENGYITCASAFKLAGKIGISYSELGKYADTFDIRLSKCRIGLFGYGKGVKLVKKLDTVDDRIEEKINPLLTDNRVNCEDVLRIAEELNISPVMVGSVCQTNNIKIKNCCLGAF